MLVNLSSFEDLINADLPELLDKSKNELIDFIKLHYTNTPFLLIQATANYDSTKDLISIDENFPFVYKSLYDVKNYKNKHFEITDKAQNFLDTFYIRDRILTTLIVKNKFLITLIKYAEIFRASPDNYKIEICVFKEDFYAKNRDELQFIYFQVLLKSFGQKFHQDFENMINRKDNSLKEISLVEENLISLKKVRDDAKNKYLEIANSRSPLHKYYFHIYRHVEVITSALSREYKQIKDKESLDEKIKLEDFEYDELGFMQAVRNRFIKALNKENTTIEIHRKTKDLPNQFAVDIADVNLFYNNNFHSPDLYESIILKPLVKDFKNEIMNNILFGPADKHQKYNSDLLQHMVTLGQQYNTYKVNNSGEYKIKKGIKTFGLVELIPDSPHVLNLFTAKFAEVEIRAIDNIADYVFKEARALSTRLSRQPAEKNTKPVLTFTENPTEHQRIHGYDINTALKHIDTLPGDQLKLNFLISARSEYNQRFELEPHRDIWGNTFLDDVNPWIEFYQKLIKKPMHSKIANQISQSVKPIQEVPSQDLMPWNDQINILVDIFIQLSKEIKNPGDKPMLTASTKQLSKFILNNFADANGKPLKPASINSFFSPSKESKRPKEGKKINIKNKVDASPKNFFEE